MKTRLTFASMACIVSLVIIYIIINLIITGVNAFSALVWMIIALVFAAAASCIGIGYAIWAFQVPIKKAMLSAQKGIRSAYFGDTVKFAYERMFEKAQEYMRLWRNKSGRINVLSVVSLPFRIFAGISIYTVGSLVITVMLLLFAPIQAWIFTRKVKVSI